MTRGLTRYPGFLCLMIAGSVCAHAQLVLSDSSLLSVPAYVEHRIRSVSDADLFQSLDLSRPVLHPVAEALSASDTAGAYRVLGALRDSIPRPRYAFKSYRMQINTERLAGYDDVRASLPRGSADRAAVLARADSILRNVIPVWGSRLERFGDPVDFNRDLGRSARYGFHYWNWSQALTAAHLLTGDQRYLDKFQELFLQWYSQRNAITRGFPEFDVVYYELGLGVRSRFFVEYYLMPHPGRRTQTHERMLKSLLAAGRWLDQLQRWEGYRPGNWQIHGSYALVQIALTVPEFREAGAWLETGLQRLEEHLDRDFYEDGGHWERCPNNYTLSMHLLYRNVEHLLRVHGLHPPFLNRLRASLAATHDWFLAMITPTGMFPAVNDSHRGHMPPPVLEENAFLLDAPWTLGVLSGIFGDGRHEGAPLPPWTSRHLATSGFTVFRSGWTRDALYMVVNHGPYGGGHTHHDILSFEMFAFGKPLAVDAGIPSTYDDTLYVPWYKSSRAHTMVVLNGENLEREETTGERVVWHTTPGLEYLAASHRGYERRGAIMHRRIAFVRPFYWMVLDEVDCTRDGDTLSWAMLTPERIRTTVAGFRSTGAPGIDVSCLDTVATAEVEEVRAASPTAGEPGVVAPVHRVALSKPTLAGRSVRFPILLSPFRDGEKPAVGEEVSERHFLIRRDSVEDHVYFPDGVFDDGEVKTDAACLLMRWRPGAAVEWAVAGGTILQYKGEILWRADGRSSADGRLIR